MLTGLLIVGIIMAMVSIFQNKEYEPIEDILTSKPKYKKILKGGKYEFAINQDTINKYNLRYVFSDLSSEQRSQIENEVKIGDSIEMHIDREDHYRNAYEMYSLKVNGNNIYRLQEYKQLQRREMIGSFGLIISSLVGWLIFKFTEFKGRNFLILIFQLFGLFVFIAYL